MLSEKTEGDVKEQGIPADPLVKEIIRKREYAKRKLNDWFTVGKEDYRFALGDQWTDEERSTLKAEGRPCLTFNRIKPLINIVSGYQRENSSRIKVNPEGGEDKIFSEVCDKALRAMDKWAHLSFKEGYWFDDGCYCGKGWMEANLVYDKDPIRGNLSFAVRSPFQILPDPDFKEYDLNDGCPSVIKLVRLAKDKLKDLYPDKADVIAGFTQDTDDALENTPFTEAEKVSGDGDDYGNRPNATTVVTPGSDEDEEDDGDEDKYLVTEYWRFKMVDRWFVIRKEDGEPEKFRTEEEAKTFSAQQGDGITPVKRKVPEMWVAAIAAGHLLQNEVSPFEPYYSGYPFFRLLADWAPNAATEELRTQGIVRSLKDPQREKNKAKSSYLHILSTQANSGWKGEEDALSPEGWKKLEKMGSQAGIVVKTKVGKSVDQIHAQGPHVGHIQREEKADEEFKQISTINADLMGMQEGTASGRAISLRIKQAVLALARLFFNYRYSKDILGNFMLQVMPLVFDVKKLKKTVGVKYIAENTSPQYPKGLTDGVFQAFLTMVSDHKYDTSITEADQNSTIRFETFQELSELLKAGAPIPIDLILEYMDLPNSADIKKRVQEEKAQQAAAAATTAKGAGSP